MQPDSSKEKGLKRGKRYVYLIPSIKLLLNFCVSRSL